MQAAGRGCRKNSGLIAILPEFALSSSKGWHQNKIHVSQFHFLTISLQRNLILSRIISLYVEFTTSNLQLASHFQLGGTFARRLHNYTSAGGK